MSDVRHTRTDPKRQTSAGWFVLSRSAVTAVVWYRLVRSSRGMGCQGWCERGWAVMGSARLQWRSRGCGTKSDDVQGAVLSTVVVIVRAYTSHPTPALWMRSLGGVRIHELEQAYPADAQQDIVGVRVGVHAHGRGYRRFRGCRWWRVRQPSRIVSTSQICPINTHQTHYHTTTSIIPMPIPRHLGVGAVSLKLAAPVAALAALWMRSLHGTSAVPPFPMRGLTWFPQLAQADPATDGCMTWLRCALSLEKSEQRGITQRTAHSSCVRRPDIVGRKVGVFARGRISSIQAWWVRRVSRIVKSSAFPSPPEVGACPPSVLAVFVLFWRPGRCYGNGKLLSVVLVACRRPWAVKLARIRKRGTAIRKSISRAKVNLDAAHALAVAEIANETRLEASRP
ncbi:hypothetical protein D9611_012534 [Ephemerocybe angulata]|uniref:Uncharacterized protein n=1 Tax=Ephemerocybe angulata TaxID=980116 RepID=A0A8H5FJ80_9AGAR|nr:hypothetical protein D9611_012534 [Tulosesus angulatus]